MKEYVTYVHLLGGKPCYVGEGTVFRPYDFKVRSEEYQLFLLMNDIKVKIVGFHGDKVSAYLNEQGLIAWIGVENLFNKEKYRHQKCDSHGFEGKQHKPETIALMKEKRKNQVFSRETCEKIGAKLRGTRVPEERVRRISESLRSLSRLTCPYCGKIGGVSNMKRYHFENCKHKP